MRRESGTSDVATAPLAGAAGVVAVFDVLGVVPAAGVAGVEPVADALALGVAAGCWLASVGSSPLPYGFAATGGRRSPEIVAVHVPGK